MLPQDQRSIPRLEVIGMVEGVYVHPNFLKVTNSGLVIPPHAAKAASGRDDPFGWALDSPSQKTHRRHPLLILESIPVVPPLRMLRVAVMIGLAMSPLERGRRAAGR